jgi:hypothetical protein
MSDPSVPPPLNDAQFVAALRAAVECYLAAVDQWEAAYQKYYRLPGFAAHVGDDLAEEQRLYEVRRREFDELLPRARRLCLKHSLRDAFSGMLRITLGEYAPQQRLDSAIGRGERLAAVTCLAQLYEASQDWSAVSAEPGETAQAANGGSLLRRLVSYFY